MARESEPEWLHLGDSENVVWQSRPHPVAMGARLPIAIGLVLVGFVLAGWGVTGDTPDPGLEPLQWIGLLIAIGGTVVAAVQYVNWTNTRYVITSTELYEKRGVISRDVTQFRLDRVRNTNLRQSAVGRVLGYGDLTVYIAGSGKPELIFERMPRPGRANAALSEQLGDDDRASTSTGARSKRY